MNCKKCNCTLDKDEQTDIEKLAMPKVCTECLNDWLDDETLDVIATGGESVE